MVSLAVVPIFVNAGFAILPAVIGAVIGAVSSVVGVLLRPRKFAALVARRPWTSVAVALCLAGAIYGAVAWDRAARAAAAQQTARQTAEDYWIAAALEALARRELAATSAPSTAAATTSAPTSPVTFGFDSSRRSYGGGSSPLGLKLLWSRQKDYIFISSPIVHGDAIYAAGFKKGLASQTGGVFRFDSDGKLRWQLTQTEDGKLRAVMSSPAATAGGENIVIGQGLHIDEKCPLSCIDTATGKVRWQAATPLHIEGSPAIWRDIAVVGAGAIEDDDHMPTGHAGEVLAVRITDGKVLWRHQVNDPESSPAISSDGIVFIGSGFNGSAVVALRIQGDEELAAAAQKRELWRTACPYPMTGPVTLAGDLVIAGGGNGDFVYTSPRPAGVVVALDRATGELRWRRDMPDSVLGPIAAGDGKLICPVRGGEVVALALADGKVLWRTRISGKSPVLAGVAFTGPCVYAVSSDGYLAVLDAADGSLIEKHFLNDDSAVGEGLCVSTPFVAGGRVVVGSETGGLRCYVGTRWAK